MKDKNKIRLHTSASMKQRILKALVPWSFAVAVLLFAFLMSSQDRVSSNGLSGRITEHVLRALTGGVEWIRESPNWVIRVELNVVLRKLAHMALFYFFTLFAMLGMRYLTSSKQIVFSASILMSLTAGVMDELIQYFSAGRNSSATDVLIDLTGTAIAVLSVLVYLVVKKCHHWFSRGWIQEVSKQD